MDQFWESVFTNHNKRNFLAGDYYNKNLRKTWGKTLRYHVAEIGHNATLTSLLSLANINIIKRYFFKKMTFFVILLFLVA